MAPKTVISPCYDNNTFVTDTNVLACVSVLHFGEKSVIVFLHVSFDHEIIINYGLLN